MDNENVIFQKQKKVKCILIKHGFHWSLCVVINSRKIKKNTFNCQPNS